MDLRIKDETITKRDLTITKKDELIAKKEELEKTLSMINSMLLEDYNSVEENKRKMLGVASTGK